MKYITKEWDIPSEEDVEDDEDKLKIYEVKSKAWDFIITSLIYIHSSLFRQCDENAHESCKTIIDKYEVSDEKQDSLNEVTSRWNNLRIKDTSQDYDICFNDIFKPQFKED